MGALMLLQMSCSTTPEKATSFKAIFDHYKSREGIVALSLPPGLMSLVIPEDGHEMSEMKDLMGELSSFRMLTVDKASEELCGELRSLVTDFTYRKDFSDLFRLQGGEGDIFIRILEDEHSIREAVLMFSNDGEFLVVDLRGNISMELFTGLMEEGHLAGIGNLAGFI